MMDETERRQALADFLRTRRARLSPADVSLPAGGRRRAPGLRREEVAQLANVGVSWYTSLEQGRDVHPSEQVLESLAQALRLTPAERDHLFLLARQHPSARIQQPEEQVSPALQQVVDALDPHPAYVLGRRWDVLAWNRAAEHIFPFITTLTPHPRNLLWGFFTDPMIREISPDWEHAARVTVARFRAESARYPADPWFAELIEDLQRTSAQFRLWWSQHDVHGITDGHHKEWTHPTLGRLEFEHMPLQVPANPDLKLMVYTASPATAARLERLLLGTSDSSSPSPFVASSLRLMADFGESGNR